GLDVRIVKPTMFKQTNNLVGYFFDINPTVYLSNWQSTGIVTSKTATIKLSGTDFSNAEPNGYIAFGIGYTYLFQLNVSLNVYYGPGVDIAPLNQITFGTATAVGQKDIQ